MRLPILAALFMSVPAGWGGWEHLAAAVWSRRLTQEHRIVYLVHDDRIDFLQARYHY